MYFFSPLIPCLDNLNDDENEIKSDYDGNEILVISRISIHPNYEIF